MCFSSSLVFCRLCSCFVITVSGWGQVGVMLIYSTLIYCFWHTSTLSADCNFIQLRSKYLHIFASLYIPHIFIHIWPKCLFTTPRRHIPFLIQINCTFENLRPRCQWKVWRQNKKVVVPDRPLCKTYHLEHFWNIYAKFTYTKGWYLPGSFVREHVFVKHETIST